MLRFFPLVWKNTLRNPRRTVLTVSSLALSLCLLGLMMAIYYAFYVSETPPAQALRLLSRNRVSLTMSFPSFYMDRIRKTPGVKDAMPWQWFGGTYKDARDPKNFFPRFGVDPKKLFVIYPEIKLPEDQKATFLADRLGCIVGRPLAQTLGLHVGDRLTLMGDIYPMNLELTVRGIYDNELGAETMFFHWDYVREALPAARKDVLSTISILAESPETVARTTSAIDEQFRNATIQMRTETERAFGLAFLGMLGNVKLILLSICAAVTFTIMLVAGNTMAMSVRERVREIGILKTLGFRRGQILSLILGEAAVLSILGSCVGGLLASGLCTLIRGGPALNNQIKTLSLQAPVVAAIFAAGLGIALTSSLFPAWRASQVTILEGLRANE
ncbi:MAG: ABC transporter permease [Candidatus Solibacter usitatus]|nr:ABC transporter permease [Candidatus Solibacter usitatus]